MSNDNHTKRFSKGNGSKGDNARAKAVNEERLEDARSEAGQAAGEANEGTQAILSMLKGVEQDISENLDEASGVIVVVSWKDGTITSGWTGGFDLERTAGKLFNLATDFSVVNLRHKSLN
jgi:hypothetical protein